MLIAKAPNCTFPQVRRIGDRSTGVGVPNLASQLQLNAIARQLNQRPRKTLGFHTPAEMFSERVALTG
jgi:hypothetical protein